MTTVRTPSATVLESSLTDGARTVPGQCSASEPQVPILRSVTPVSLTVMVYGWLAIVTALNPTPNHAAAGPDKVISTSPEFDLSEMSPGIAPDHFAWLPHD